MKVSEIQIGDYVNYRGQIIKVTSLYDKGGSNEVGWSDKESVWVNAINVEPIPLTPEILEKNGFRKRPHQDNSWVNDESDARYVCFSIGEALNLWGGCDQDYVWVTVQYVHQFQHALRLCGIDKEIKL